MSATDRVGIEIDLMGYDQAMKQMESLDSMVKGLSGRKGYLKIKAEIEKVNMNKRALRAHKVKLEADTRDVEKSMTRVNNQLNRAKRNLNALKEGKVFSDKTINAKAIKAAEAEIERLIAEYNRLNSIKMELGDRMRNVQTEINSATSYLERLNAAFRKAGKSALSFGQIAKGISSSAAHIGSAMQSAGNAISRFMTPFRMMGTGAMLGLGYKALNTATEGLQAGFKRYDIMAKYPKMMAEYSKANYTAKDSINELDQAVRGLPTGLDEIVEMSQRYTLSLGDMEKGTKLAIATNNAFLASMTTESQRYQGMMQMQDLMNGKKLNSREWMSLGSSMGKAINEIGKELGYTNKNMGEFRQKLYGGQIASEDFLDALIKVGTGTGKVAKLAELSKDTWEAFGANIKNAFSRMGAGTIKALDQIVKIATGGEYTKVNRFLADNVAPGIDSLAKSVRQWIKAHPDDIISFFNDLKSIDWKGLGTGFVKGIGELVKGVQGIAKWLGGRSLEGVGKWIVRLNMLGQGLLIFGGMIKGMRHLIGGSFATIISLGRVLGGLGMVGASEKLLGFVNFFKNFGKVGKAAETASKVAGVGGVGGAATLGATFKAFIPAIEALAGVGAILTMATGIAALDTKLLSMAVNNMIKITDGMGQVFRNVKGLKGQDFDGSALKNAVEQMFQMWEVFSGTGETVDAHGVKRGGGRSIAQMDKKLLGDMAESMKSMSSILGSMALMKQNLKGLKGFKGFDEKMTEGITNFATALGGIYSAFEEAFGGEGVFNKGAINPEQAQGFADIITSTETMFASLGKIVNKIPKVLTGLTNLVKTPGGMGESPVASLKKMLIGEDTTGGLFKDIHDIFQKLKDDFQNIDTGVISEKMGNVVTAIQSIRKIGNQLSKMGSAGTLNSEGIDTAIANIKSFVSKLSTALDTTVVGDIQNKVGALRTTINGIFQALNTDLSNVEVTVNIKGEVKGADDLVSKINKAHTQITNAVRKIPSTITKTVTVNINGSVNNNLPSIPSLDHPPHTGGYITGKHSRPLYRAKGGIINPFRPKGTDTVPTVLTPGEYVMKRSAVDAFGVRFMQRINNMDIRGAMRELSARAGHIASVNRGTTNYITNNNNQQVTQHINTSNPNFAYKRSNRYVMAL